MHPLQFKDAIIRAVHNTDPGPLDALAAHMASCERANAILRAKGYGESGMAIDATVRAVPNARPSDEA